MHSKKPHYVLKIEKYANLNKNLFYKLIFIHFKLLYFSKFINMTQYDKFCFTLAIFKTIKLL